LFSKAVRRKLAAMSEPPPHALTVHQRRRALRLAQLNGGLWAVGNGLATTTLIIYLAQEFGAAGLVVSLILAAPQWAGVSRVWAADMVARRGDRKRFCLSCFYLSNLLLVALPVICEPGLLGSPQRSLAALVILWTLYHLAEYFGAVALWSWLGDLAPARVRGRFLGRRERWLTVGRIVGMVASPDYSSVA
jgi:MFS family permease